MAVAEHITPGLRAYPVFSALPKGCIAFPVTDESSDPILRPGEFVVVDTDQREPVDRELALIQWSNGSRTIRETWLRAGSFGCGPRGSMIDTFAWFVGAYNRPRGQDQVVAWVKAGRRGGWVDGPYATEGEHAGYLASKIVGRIVGIFEPLFDEATLRTVA